ncbi:MAG: hypothetical protein K2Q34_08120, partial [Alphaproteobacteria bacterium]|nr:hypothetical protein [Alphaproteobacteria bacterium]
RARESGFLVSEKATSTDDCSLQEKNGEERKSKTRVSSSTSSGVNSTSSRISSHSSFLDRAETQQKVEELFKENESSLSSKQKQMESHSATLKENVLTGQKRGLIESVSKGPLSHLSELGRKIKGD